MTPLKLIDSHTHPQLDDFSDDRDQVIQRSLNEGIGMVVVGTTLKDSVEAVRLAEQYTDQPIWAAVGVHPTDGDVGEVHPAQLASLLSHPKVVAIGETGLDFFRIDPDDTETRQLQADAFEQHLLLAAQEDKPLMIHTRDRDGVYEAYEQMLTLLTRHQYQRFVMHCYSGTWELAERFIALGGYISFTGILTFPKSEMMQEVARRAPLDKIMIETDAPFLAPVPYRGKRNEPAYVQFVAEQLATLRGIAVEEASSATLVNTQRFLNIKKPT